MPRRRDLAWLCGGRTVRELIHTKGVLPAGAAPIRRYFNIAEQEGEEDEE